MVNNIDDGMVKKFEQLFNSKTEALCPYYTLINIDEKYVKKVCTRERGYCGRTRDGTRMLYEAYSCPFMVKKHSVVIEDKKQTTLIPKEADIK